MTICDVIFPWFSTRWTWLPFMIAMTAVRTQPSVLAREGFCPLAPHPVRKILFSFLLFHGKRFHILSSGKRIEEEANKGKTYFNVSIRAQQWYMQMSSLIHRYAYAGHDGIDRSTQECLAATPPVLLLMGLLIDGPVWTSLVRSGCWDEIHLHPFTYQSTKLETRIM